MAKKRKNAVAKVYEPWWYAFCEEDRIRIDAILRDAYARDRRAIERQERRKRRPISVGVLMP